MTSEEKRLYEAQTILMQLAAWINITPNVVPHDTFRAALRSAGKDARKWLAGGEESSPSECELVITREWEDDHESYVEGGRHRKCAAPEDVIPREPTDEERKLFQECWGCNGWMDGPPLAEPRPSPLDDEL